MAGLSAMAGCLPRTLARGLLFLFATAVLLTGCGRAKPEPEPIYGTWRGVLTVTGGDLPFGLEIAREDGRDIAWLINGPERARVTDVVIDGGHISMGMPGYPHRLEARLVDGELQGEVTFLRPKGETRSTHLVAERGISWRFFPVASTSNADFSGRWRLTFRDPATGAESTGIAEFTQQGHAVTGTVLRESGDDRYIAGEARGDTVFLSRFDGGHAYLYVARLGPDGTLEGELRSGTGTFRQLSGYRDADAQLADVSDLTVVDTAGGPLSFAFPDINGNEVSLTDERFRDKLVIITIGGTWCPNCHDEAAFLRDFLPTRRERGLEVVQLMFEYTDDFASASASVRNFADKFNIGYPVLIAGSYGPGAVQNALPQLKKFFAYPTLLVLDRAGRIRYTHTGFSGPATGVHYDEFVSEFSALIDGLLAEA
jgi:peroxiredoxin